MRDCYIFLNVGGVLTVITGYMRFFANEPLPAFGISIGILFAGVFLLAYEQFKEK